MLLKFLCGYTQTKSLLILSNSGRIFTLQLCGSGNILLLFTLIIKNNNCIVKWLATDACPVKVWLVSSLEEVRGVIIVGLQEGCKLVCNEIC